MVTERDIAAQDLHTASRLQASDMNYDTALEADSSWSGGSIWDSSELLAQILIEKPAQFWQAHPRVLELGTGCGLVAISAAAIGARYIVATDQIVYMAQHNVEANFPPGSTERTRIDVRELRWGCAEDMSAILSLRSSPLDGEEDGALKRGKKSDQDTALEAPYDLILGSDCIYNRDNHARLARTIDFMAGTRATVLW
eukprot:COSAG02_NODE_4480_length_5314_cov_6.582167_8_plen_198_part_00